MELIKTLPEDECFSEFVNAPKVLFANDFVLQSEFLNLNREYLVACFYVKEDENLLGTMAFYNNPGHFLNNKKTGCVGYFQSVDDENVLKILLDAVKIETQKAGIKHLLGPMNGTTWESYRFRTSDSQPPFFLEHQNPLYYNELFLKCGFYEIQDYCTYRFSSLQAMSERTKIREQQLADKGVVFRQINIDEYEEEMRSIYELCLVSFKHNRFYTPYKWEAFIGKYKKLQPYTKAEMTMLAEDKNGRIIGFIFTLDDIFCTTHKQFIFKTYAVLPDHEYKGLGAVLAEKLTEQHLNNGYTSSIHAFVINEGTSSNYSSKGAEIYRNYKLYALDL